MSRGGIRGEVPGLLCTISSFSDVAHTGGLILYASVHLLNKIAGNNSMKNVLYYE